MIWSSHEGLWPPGTINRDPGQPSSSPASVDMEPFLNTFGVLLEYIWIRAPYKRSSIPLEPLIILLVDVTVQKSHSRYAYMGLVPRQLKEHLNVFDGKPRLSEIAQIEGQLNSVPRYHLSSPRHRSCPPSYPPIQMKD